MTSRNRLSPSVESASGGSSHRLAPGSIRRRLREDAKTKSRLQLMSATGFIQDHEMGVFGRTLRFMRLPHVSELFMSVDHHQIWRRHIAWSFKGGDQLRNAVTSRFASNMVFMSLLLGTEIGVLFSPSKPADAFRAALRSESRADPNFWAAIVLCVSIGLTLSGLVANFTARAIIGAVSSHNSHAILRSSVGLDAAQLPARLAILSIYCFLTWVIMFLWILVPSFWGILIALLPVVLIAYIVMLYSSLGRLVIYSRAMQSEEIFSRDEENDMSPTRLFEELLKRAEKEKEQNKPVPLVYRSKRALSERLASLRLVEQVGSEDMGFGSSHANQHVSKILNGSDRDADPLPTIDVLLEAAEEGESGRNHGVPQDPSATKQPQDREDMRGPLSSTLRPRANSRFDRRSSGLSRGREESSQNLMNSPAASLTLFG